jgi:diguanylate cyclase (GGDEF)-like protein
MLTAHLRQETLATSVAFVSLRPIATIGASFYVTFAMIVQLTAAQPGGRIVATLAAGIGAAMLVLRLLLNTPAAIRIERHALAVVAGLALACLTIPALVFTLTGVAYPAVGLTVIIVVMGVVVHHRVLYLSLLAAALGMWAGAVAVLGAPVHPIQLAVEMGIVTAGSLAVHGVSRRVAARLEAARQRLEHQAVTDELTGLANARGIEILGAQHLARAHANGTEIAVIYVDMDELKRVNDAGGHRRGDEHIRRAADKLRAIVRPSDMLARVGGDEFVILCAGLHHNDAAALRDRLESELDHAGLPASIGVTISQPTMTLDDAINEADQQMYQVKRARQQATSQKGTRA